jgi:hypothetical protein
MSELVRWEFEEVLVRQNDIWSLGALLQGRGYVNPQQRRELETVTTSGQDRGSVVDAYRNIVTTEQLDECLAMQETLTATDDELVMGWNPQSNISEEGRFAWYCAGTGDGIRAHWAQAFKKHGVFCSWIYPQLGAGFPLMDFGKATSRGFKNKIAARVTREGRLLVDIRQEQFGLFQGMNGRLDSMSIQPCPYGTAEPKSVADAAAKFIHPNTRVVYVSAPLDHLEPISGALQQVLGGTEIMSIPVIEPDAKGQFCPRPVLTSLQGVARHALKLCGPDMLVRIKAQPPKPPIWKSREFWPWAIIVLLIVILSGIETFLRVQTEKNDWNRELEDIKLSDMALLRNEARETRTEIMRLEKVLAEKERELNEKSRRKDVLNDVIRYRQELVPGLLQAISEAVPGEVQLDLLEESDDRSGFYLEGWAFRDTAGQIFADQLNDKLAPWNYKVADWQLSRSKRRFGIEGFILKGRLIKTDARVEGNDD